MYRVLLVNPPVLGVFEPWYDTPDFGRVGLAYLAGWLRKFPGFEIRILDAKFERKDFSETLAEILQWKPDLIGFTAFTNEIKPAAYLAALLKKANPGIVTVIGGVHVTALPVQTMMEFPSFDFGVAGEGEITFQELCIAIRDKQELKAIPGILFRDGGKIIETSLRFRIQNQDDIPWPAWDLMPRAKTYFVHSLRGCPFHCSFCMNPNGRIARQRGVNDVIAEIEWIIETYHPKRISFGDELFSVDMERTHRLLDEMIAKGIGKMVEWDIQTHVAYVDEDILRKMKTAGIKRVELGIETGDDATLKSMGKGTNRAQILAAREAARKAGVSIGTFFILGHPGESRETIRKTVDLAVKMNPDLPMFGIMVPYPGTEVSRLAAEGKGGYRLLSTDWDEYNKQLGGALEFGGLSRKQIEKIQIWAYIRIFLFNFRFLDLAGFTWEYRKGAWSVLRKLFRKDSSLSNMLNKPLDYDSTFEKGAPMDPAGLVRAREVWKEIQKEEMVESKKQKEERRQ